MYEMTNEWEAFEMESLDAQGELNEAEEMELAAELLGIQSEEEMEEFLGKLFRGISRTAGGLLKSPIGKALGGLIKPIAGKLLPIAGAALGNFVVPGLGGVVGGKLASMAGQALGLELEGLSNEDREFEIARRIVRLSGAAARNALALQDRGYPAAVVARQAFARSVRRHAPLLPSMMRRAAVRTDDAASYAGGPVQSWQESANEERPTSGRWVRRGRTLILLGT